jgi:hypothetical protein
MMERDWGRACAKEKFMSMLARENRACTAGKPDKVALAEVHDVIKRHYPVRLGGRVVASTCCRRPLPAGVARACLLS